MDYPKNEWHPLVINSYEIGKYIYDRGVSIEMSQFASLFGFSIEDLLTSALRGSYIDISYNNFSYPTAYVTGNIENKQVFSVEFGTDEELSTVNFINFNFYKINGQTQRGFEIYIDLSDDPLPTYDEQQNITINDVIDILHNPNYVVSIRTRSEA